MDPQFCPAEFAAELQGMATEGVVKIVGNMPGGIRSALGGGFPPTAVGKTVDFDVWCPKVGEQQRKVIVTINFGSTLPY